MKIEKPTDHGRFLAQALAQAVLAGAWTACRELPTAKRRIARISVMGATALVGIASQGDRRAADTGSPPRCAPTVTTEAEVPTASTPSQAAAVVVAGVGATAAVMVGGRWLEKRWLTGLVRNGHAHPHRALGVRMAALSFGVSAAIHLLETHAAAQPGSTPRT